jgi:hypothetical protein
MILMAAFENGIPNIPVSRIGSVGGKVSTTCRNDGKECEGQDPTERSHCSILRDFEPEVIEAPAGL